VVVAAREGVLEGGRATADRLAYLRLLGFADFEFRREVLWQLLSFQHPYEIQMAAMRQVVEQRDPAVAAELIERWRTLNSACRALASDVLIHRSQNHLLLLSALEEGRLPMGQLNLDLERRRRLLWSDDEAVRRRAEALFSDAGVVTRAEVLASLKPALQLAGDARKGEIHYRNLCAQCHTIGTNGYAVGPDLTEIFRKGAETLLSDVFDPNAAVNIEYLGTTIDDDEGEVFTGIVLAETDDLVRLREAGGVDRVISRERIVSMSSGGLSLMPEGLEVVLSAQDVADLLAFLQTSR